MAVVDLTALMGVTYSPPLLNGYFAGTTKETGAPPTPVSAKLYLYLQSDGSLLRSITTNPDGSYLMNFVDPVPKYFMVTVFGTGTYDVESRGFLTPTAYP